MVDVARVQIGTAAGRVSESDNKFGLEKIHRLNRIDWSDLGSVALLALLAILVLATFRDYAITNDEWVQHRYGELIIAYYKSGFKDRSVFNFANLYLYGGLFDVIAVLLSHVVPLDLFDLRHLMSAITGVAGLGSTIAVARLIAGPRAGLLAGVVLAVTGSWYGTMFHHTKDIPLGAAMAGALYFLVRAARDCPRCQLRHIIGFGVFAGIALGIKVLGLLLVCYIGPAVALNTPLSAWQDWRKLTRFWMTSIFRFIPALVIAYFIMIVAWPWSALSPLNPIYGLFSFSEFHYGIRTVLNGHVYLMATVPSWYVPIYILIKVPLLMLAGAMLALAFAMVPRFAGPAWSGRCSREIGIVAMAGLFPIVCEFVLRGPAFSGLRHFLFVLPPLAMLAGIGLNLALSRLAKRNHVVSAIALATVVAVFGWNAVTLYRLHPYEYLVYNPVVGGLQGATRRYVTDYWFTVMPEAVRGLEAYLARTEPSDDTHSKRFYTVALCGERASFLYVAPPNLHWAQVWETADFFIAPTHMNCDFNSNGKKIVTVERTGVPIGFVKDQRAEANTQQR
jgi:hypothetical protein